MSIFAMDEETVWFTDAAGVGIRTSEFDSLNVPNDETNATASVALDVILPDELLERILTYLPIASILRVGSVCRRWNEIVSARKFAWNMSNVTYQKPWYFMFTSSDDPIGHAFDPILRKWYSLVMPCINTSKCLIAASCGLVCVMDNNSRRELYVCNPITRLSKRLVEPPDLTKSDYSALAISVNRQSHSYTISVVKSKQVPGNFYEWDLSIHSYNSGTQEWLTSLSEVLSGWRGGDESVICGGVLYFLIYSTGSGTSACRHGLVTYSLSSKCPQGLLIRNYIPVPIPLTCGKLMNLKEKLVMVGGIGKHDRPDVIKGIGVWLLKGKEWQEIARMPHKFFQGFGELDDVFASSGTDDIIYIQSYGAPALLIFDMNQKQFKWSLKCPVTKRFPLQLFTGFCFEPRLEVSP